jgi:hypothetical protein
LERNERSLRETPCRLSETSNRLSENSLLLSENSPLLSERVINKRTRTVKTRGSLKYFLAGLLIWSLITRDKKRLPLLKME